MEIQSIRELVERVVPFMDVYLPPSKKRRQYLAWREEVLDHWEHRARRRRPRTEDGCIELSRAKGHCRRHDYQRFGR